MGIFCLNVIKTWTLGAIFLYSWDYKQLLLIIWGFYGNSHVIPNTITENTILKDVSWTNLGYVWQFEQLECAFTFLYTISSFYFIYIVHSYSVAVGII